MKPVKAITLAGGDLDSSFKEKGEKAVNKNFIKINNKFMVEYVIDALKKAELVEEIILAAPENTVPEYLHKNVTIIKSGLNIIETVLNGIKFLPENTEQVLLVMADLPLLKPEGVDDFIRRSRDIEGDYYYSILTREVSEKTFPNVSHTYIKLKDGTFCGGGLVLMNPQICDTFRCSLMYKIIESRKNPLEMAKILGAKTLLKIISGQISVKDLEKRTSEVFKCKARGIITPYAEIGLNVDKPGELEIVRSLFN